MKRLALSFASLGALAACATAPPPDTATIETPAFTEARVEAPSPIKPSSPPAPATNTSPTTLPKPAQTIAAQPLSGQALLGQALPDQATPRQATPSPAAPSLPAATAKPSPIASAKPDSKPSSQRRTKPPGPLEALASANKAARQTPAGATFLNATVLYAYEPGAIYELHTTPAFISTMVLDPGETLVDVAAGDTARWSVSNTLAGSGAHARTLVMVKPQEAGLRTNIVLVTSQRAYLIEAISAAGDAYTAQIAWRYPEPPPPPVVVAPDPIPRAINEGYRIRPPRKGAPAWTPVRVFDDGLKTWIEFPTDIASSDMPPMFVSTPEGAELVNYRVQGHHYVVDRMFETAELRLGRVDPIVVRIERQSPPKSRAQPRTAPRAPGGGS